MLKLEFAVAGVTVTVAGVTVTVAGVSDAVVVVVTIIEAYTKVTMRAKVPDIFVNVIINFKISK